MRRSPLAAALHRDSGAKIVFIIADGLGGLRDEVRGGTELEVAETPHLDTLARSGVTGLLVPVEPGITCGSGPGHLALFGYDPLEYNIGRGVLTALGIDFDLQPGDVAARGNFCTVDTDGTVLDRRAGRISSEQGEQLVERLQQTHLEDVEVVVRAVKEHRFLLVIRGHGLGADVTDTDPQTTGVRPRPPRPADQRSRRTAAAVEAFVEQARQVLGDAHPANMVLLRGFEQLPHLPSMRERYGLTACALAGYPMYRGIARLLGMCAIECGPVLGSEIDALHSAWDRHDFFFLHYKDPDRAGEDGDFEAKVRAIEELDRQIPRVAELRPDVLVVTGDHSTPSQLRSHSWHPVPVLLTAQTCRRDAVDSFGETACTSGGLSQMPTTQLMTLALAHARRLQRYGA